MKSEAAHVLPGRHLLQVHLDGHDAVVLAASGDLAHCSARGHGADAGELVVSQRQLVCQLSATLLRCLKGYIAIDQCQIVSRSCLVIQLCTASTAA
jgi:hypothetical protein